MCDGITIGGNVSIQISGPCAPADGSVTAAKINSGNAVDGQVLTADGSGGAAWETPSGGGPGYLEYVALITESNPEAPLVVTILKNTLGGQVVWTKVAEGHYKGTLAGAFVSGKTTGFTGLESYTTGTGNFPSLYTNTNEIHIASTSGDYGLNGCPIEIRVYP